MIEEGIAKDLSMVVENAKLMGCQEVNSNYPYCGHCGQRIKWDIEWSMETEE